ncbi:MAG: tRNA (adenosine(37)-N6)-threonylcarbamoyltransferase complex transferase subunit TsaD [Candidatus Liptonbacteria bacterium]
MTGRAKWDITIGMKPVRILAIETSCDETALALMDASGGLENPRFKVLKHVIASQIETHRPFGGVVPNLAKREHIKNLPVLLEKLNLKDKDWLKIDYIAVTVGPGLEPALWTGINFAKELSKKHEKPVLGANHLEGHLYSFLLEKIFTGTQKSSGSLLKKIFPAIGLIVSGGHTVLLTLSDFKTRKKLGETRDDAAGEAYDKVARLLGLPYPGGPEIEKVAKTLHKNWEDKINFPRPMIHEKNYDFSFSGLKTAVLYYLRDNLPNPANDAHGKQSKLQVKEIAGAFQVAAVDVLSAKTFRAAEELNAKSILLSGGVSANKFLRGELARRAKEHGMQFYVADFAYNTDNAAIIGLAAYLNLLRGKKYPLRARGDLKI